jgi:Dolichyl-phosphate-mannose-protein mannosyltransferase
MISLLIICLLSAVVGRLVFLCNPFDADAAIFIYMGKMTYLGGRMCHDFLDNKFPTVGLMMTLPWRLLGNQWAAYVLFSSTLALASCLILAETARRGFGRNAGMATLFFSLVYLNFTRTVFGGFQLETFQIFFDCVAVFFLFECLRSDRWAPALTAGMAAGCAAMFKPTGLSVLAAFVICRIVSSRPNLKQILAIVGGVAIPAAAALAYLIAADLLSDMPALYRQITGYAANSAVGLPNLLKLPTILCVLAVPMFFRFWLFRRRPIEMSREAHITASQFFVLAWFCLEIIAVIMQRRMYWYHFLVLAPPAAMIFGMMPRRSSAILIAACVMPLAILSIGAASDALDQLYKGSPTLPTSDYLLAHASPGDVIWDENASRLLLETNLRAGSRCVLTFLFANTDNSPTIFSKQILSDFAASRPKYIVLKTRLDNWVYYETRNIWDIEDRPMRRVNYVRAWKNIDAYVKQNYVPVAQMDKDTIWERRGSGDAVATVK